MKLYRQGNVLFKQVKSIPPGGIARPSGHILEGKATGHVHRVAEQDLGGVQVLDCAAGLFLSVSAEGGVSIVHEEHHPIALPSGNYEVVRQREYSPKEIRNVTD